MRRYTKYIYVFFLSLLSTFVGCDGLDVGHEKSELSSGDDGLVISKPKFDPDYKRFAVEIDSKYDLSDSSRMEVLELDQFGDTLPSRVASRVILANNNRAVEVASVGVEKVLVIVDMTLSEERVEAQKKAVSRMLNAFNNGNLYISFMWSESISKSVPVTQYILDNHFESHPSKKLLLRSILTKIDEMSGHAPRYFWDISREDLWQDVESRYKKLIVFSDGVTYSDNQPMDHLHYQVQKQIAELRRDENTPVVDYVNFGAPTTNESERDLSIELIVERCGGVYYDSFNLNSLLSTVIEPDRAMISGYEMVFENPDGRLYMGAKHRLIMNYHESDSLVYSGEQEVVVGSLYDPVIVHGTPIAQLLARGLFMTIVLVSILYVILQFVVPYISYQLFRRKYVRRYDGPGSMANGAILLEECYFCKEKFEVGDMVVAKCQHTMHESCWEESGYKCPDYGARCKDGSHYYNSKNLFDGANSSIYMKWILCGCVAAFLAWGCNLLFGGWYNDLPFSLLGLVKMILGDGYATIVGGLVVSEFFGLSLVFFTTLYIATFLSRGNWFRRRVWQIILRVIAACVIVYLAYAVALVIYIAIGVKSTIILVDWIPWVLIGAGMVYLLSYKKPIDKTFALKGALVSVALVFVTIYVWRFTDLAYFDMRMSQLLTCLVFCTGLSIALAAKLPTSNRYFLRVSGAIKDMDIALYKWFNGSNGYSEVVVGKSVSSDICMSWDLSREIAPSQFKLIRRGEKIYVVALDYGVRAIGSKREFGKDAVTRLYHGEGFTVGRTKFVYLELDL